MDKLIEAKIELIQTSYAAKVDKDAAKNFKLYVIGSNIHIQFDNPWQVCLVSSFRKAGNCFVLKSQHMILQTWTNRYDYTANGWEGELQPAGVDIDALVEIYAIAEEAFRGVRITEGTMQDIEIIQKRREWNKALELSKARAKLQKQSKGEDLDCPF